MDNQPPGYKSLRGQGDTKTKETPASLPSELELHVELLLVAFIWTNQTAELKRSLCFLRNTPTEHWATLAQSCKFSVNDKIWQTNFTFTATTTHSALSWSASAMP